MVLADTFRTLLATAKELVADPAVKQAISDDLATLENKAAQGVDVLEQHVADWFAAHYPLPAPAEATSTQPVQPAQPAEPVTAEPVTATVDPGTQDSGTAAPADGGTTVF